ncbi:unnamed protein product [Gemmataceae bacterium]|nr:unnamed protein product [Gemmataceae bacterium]VTT99897.1 unnamed protein product [Gemmataceae bacterium]
MPVELSCPKCKTKLRLSEMPDLDAEIECAKCAHTFPVEGNVVADKKPPEKPKEPEKKAEAPLPKPKKRKSKKRKTPPIVLGAIITTAVMVIGTVVGVLAYFLTKKSASMEMMSYLPDDCDQVAGLNLGHLQKYPLFYADCEKAFATSGFKKAGDVFAAAKGGDFNGTIDYVVYGSGAAGGKPGGSPLEATVLKTKEEFDPGVLAKIPGAKEGSLNGSRYYAIPDIAELGYPNLRVFAPTPRLVVFCRGDMPEAKFRGMLGGNKDNPDATPYPRAGQLGKYAIRGTVWKFTLYDRSVGRPEAPPPPKQGPGQQASQPSDDDNLKKEIADIAAPAKGSAYKASVGSRETRGEWVLWAKDSSAPSDWVKKWKDKEWVKDDEKSPPRWWKLIANKSGGGKTAENVLKDNLSFRSTGELFVIRTAMETKMIQQGITSLVGNFKPQQAGNSPTP